MQNELKKLYAAKKEHAKLVKNQSHLLETTEDFTAWDVRDEKDKGNKEFF